MRVSGEGLEPSAIVLAPLVKKAGTEKLFRRKISLFSVRIMEFFGCMSQIYPFATLVALFKWEEQTVVTVCFLAEAPPFATLEIIVTPPRETPFCRCGLSTLAFE